MRGRTAMLNAIFAPSGEGKGKGKHKKFTRKSFAAFAKAHNAAFPQRRK